MKTKMNEKFINQFKPDEQIIIQAFFKQLNQKLFLSTADRVAINIDFEKAINYYLNHRYTLKEALDLLSIDNLGSYYQDAVNNWYPLDNAAKIYPLSMKESWMSVYRISYYLKSNIVPEILQLALTFTIKRFPTFRTSVRKGFFWHYLDGIKKRFHIYEEKRIPCNYINVSNLGKQAFRVIYYKNRISIEYFHVLTDGYGAVTFLSTLVAEYLKLIKRKVSYNDLVIDINSPFLKEEDTNELNKKNLNGAKKSLADSKALELDGKLSNVRPCQLLHFDINLKDLKKVCQKKKATVTELMLAFIFMASSYSSSKDGYIKIQVPVNMRKYYPSKTLRNFSLYVMINIKKSEINSLDEVLKEIKKQMANKVNKNSLDQTMTYTNDLVNKIKFIPLFIKRPIARIVYGYLGEKVMTSVFSNLGKINLPEDIEKEIVKADFSLGTNMARKVLFSMITCNDIATLTISKFTLNSSVENSIYNLLKSEKINVKVSGSEVYDYQ